MPWLIEIKGAEVREQTVGLQTKFGAYLTPHGRMGGFNQAAVIPVRKIAFEAAEAWAPVMQRRMGAQTRLQPTHFFRDQDIDGAAVLLARARTQRWASNASVDPRAVQVVREELQAALDGCTKLSMVPASELAELLASAEPSVLELMQRCGRGREDAAVWLHRWLTTEQAGLGFEFPVK